MLTLLALLISTAAASPEVVTTQAWRGGNSPVVITGLPPRSPVFLGGTVAGPGAGPCPPLLAGECLDIRSPRLVGQGTADDNGDAVITLRLPTGFAPSQVWLQAVSTTGGVALSPVVEVSVLDPDADRDGLDDAVEALLGTDPAVSDTDHDGLGDAEEAWTLFTNPLLADTDSDGLADGEEVRALLNPTLADTDGGGWTDGEEVLTWHTDPSDGSDDLVLAVDSDSDGLADAVEARLGLDPASPDTDCDGVLDSTEVVTDTTNPRDAASWNPASVTLTPSAVCGGASSAPPQLGAVRCADTIAEGDAWACQLDAVDPEGGDVTWTVTGGPAGLTVAPTGALSWAAAVPGSYTLHARATDPDGATLDLELPLQVTGAGAFVSGVMGPGGLTLSLATAHMDTASVEMFAPPGSLPIGTSVVMRERIGAPRLGDAPTVELSASGLQPSLPVTLRWSLRGVAAVGLVEAEAPVFSSTGLRWAVERATAHIDAALVNATVRVTSFAVFSVAVPLAQAIADHPDPVDVAVKAGEFVADMYRSTCVRGPNTGEMECVVAPDERMAAGVVNCVILHGINSNGEAFDEGHAPDAGLLADSVEVCDRRIVVDYPWAKDQNVVAAEIADHLEAVRDEGATFRIIAHSNGGLVARALARLDHPAAGALQAIVTLDTPHRGGNFLGFRPMVAWLEAVARWRGEAEATGLGAVRAVAPGVANLVDTSANTEGDSFLNSLDRSQDPPMACVGAADPLYQPFVTDGLVTRESALQPCATAWRHAPSIHPYREPYDNDQQTVTLADRARSLIHLRALGLNPEVHSEVHRRALADGSIAAVAALWASIDADNDGVLNTDDCDVVGCGPAEVAPGDDLQAAVDALAAGETLELHAGTYDVYRLHIGAPGVTLRAAGDGPVVISGRGDTWGTVWIDAAADDVTVQGIHIYNTTDDPAAFDGGIYSQGDRTHIQDCSFSGPLPTAMQVYLQESVGGLVEDCSFEMFNTGIALQGAQAVIRRVHIRDGHDGMLFVEGAQASVSDALIVRAAQGFSIVDGVELDAAHVTIVDSVDRAVGLYDGSSIVAFHATLLAGNTANMECTSFSYIDLDLVYAEDGQSYCLFSGQLGIYGATLGLDANGYPTAASAAIVDQRAFDPRFALDVDRRARPFDGDGDGVARSDLGAVERLPAHATSCAVDVVTTCACELGWSWTNGACDDIDECLVDPCGGAPCANTAGGFTCDCPPNQVFDGATCADILTCAPDPCEAPLACTDNGVDLVCACPEGSQEVGGECVFPTSCATLHQAAPAAPSGRYWLDPNHDGVPFRTWCDMTSAGGGWTLLLHAGPSFRTATANALPDADCLTTPCASAAWSELPLGADLVIDGADAPLGAGTPPGRVTITGIDATARGQSLRARFDAATWVPLERDDNANLSVAFAAGYSCGTWPDFGDAACGNHVFVLRDTNDLQYLGGRLSRANEWGNLAGWPGDPNWGGGNYWPDYLRLWTR